MVGLKEGSGGEMAYFLAKPSRDEIEAHKAICDVMNKELWKQKVVVLKQSFLFQNVLINRLFLK